VFESLSVVYSLLVSLCHIITIVPAYIGEILGISSYCLLGGASEERERSGFYIVRAISNIFSMPVSPILAGTDQCTRSCVFVFRL
jgi:hypothetical protein